MTDRQAKRIALRIVRRWKDKFKLCLVIDCEGGSIADMLAFYADIRLQVSLAHTLQIDL